MIQQYKGVRATNIPHLLMTGTTSLVSMCMVDAYLL